MRDTAEMSPFEPMLERFFGRETRRAVFSTWGSIWTLMSKGGNKVWGDGAMVTFTDSQEEERGVSVNEMLAKFGTKSERSTDEFIELLEDWGGGYGDEYSKTIGISFDKFGTSAAKTKSNWHNPMTTPLPKAPSFTHYCLYGVGVDTEFAYFYKKNPYADIEPVRQSVTRGQTFQELTPPPPPPLPPAPPLYPRHERQRARQ
jgi:phospholipid:diacylglycerol acyltransferase